MKNPILDILNLQEQNSQREQILESKQKHGERLLDEQQQIDKYNFYKEAYGMNNTQPKESLFRSKVKKDLLSEGLYKIFSKCVRTPLYENTTVLQKHLVSSFINESNIDKLLNEYSNKSYLLSELTRIVLEYTQIICEKARENKDETIDPTDKEDFYDKIGEINDVAYVQNTIKARVADAINQFNIDNMQKKRDVENILIQTREKINNNMTEELREYTELKSKQKENQIRNSKKSIFESMMYNVLESCYKNEKLKEKFFMEDGSPDMDRLCDHCKIMYGFLEMLNTTGAKKLSSEYIKEQIDCLRIS